MEPFGKSVADIEARLKDLEEERKKKVWMAEKWKEYSLKNVEHVYESQLKEAQDEYDYVKQALQKRLKEIEAQSQGGNGTTATSSGTRSKKGGKRGGLATGAAGGTGSGTGSEYRMTTRNASRRKGRYDMAARDGNGVAGTGTSSGYSSIADLDPQGRLRRLNPPQISYTLSEEEIVSDLSLFGAKGILNSEERRKLYQEAMDDSLNSPMVLSGEQPSSPTSMAVVRKEEEAPSSVPDISDD